MDAGQVRVGVEYVVIQGRWKWPLRAGYFNDGQFFTVASGQVPHFHGLTVGTGIIVGPLLVDVAYLHQTGSYVDAAVHVDAKAQRLFVSTIYRFGGR